MSKQLTKALPGLNRQVSRDSYDPPWWPVGLTFIEKVEYLSALSPQMIQTIHAMVDTTLREEYWRRGRTPDGVAELQRLTAEAVR
jgi:hypothetical protein